MTFKLIGKLFSKTIARAVGLGMLAGCLLTAPVWAQDEPQGEAPPPPRSTPRSSASAAWRTTIFRIVPGTATEVGRSNRVVSRCSRGQDTGRIRLSNANCRGGAIASRKTQNQGEAI